MRWNSIIVASSTLLLTAGTGTMAQATALTGITVFSANSTGSTYGGHYWNTRPSDISYNLWIGTGSVAHPTWLNGPIDLAAGINIPLSLGSQRFTLYGEPGADTGFVGMNLFFDGNITPGISVVIPSNANSKAMAANRGSTYAMNITPIWGTGQLSFVSEGTIITLTRASWQTRNTGLDLVSAYDVDDSGVMDYVGKISITTRNTRSKVPESSPLLGLLALGLGGIGAKLRHRSRR